MTEVHHISFSKAALRLMGCSMLMSAWICGVAAQTTTAPATPAPTAAWHSSWQQLTAQQKQALSPLARQWGSLTPQQQSKWLAISQNFSQWPASEQATMHTRMADWVALSPQQRNQARFNFNVVQGLPKEDKKAKWEAYQALSAEDKRSLAVGTPAPSKSAATISKPADTVRLVAPAARTIDSAKDITRPAASAQPLDRKTLLPQAPKAVELPAPAGPISHIEGPSS
jgi:Protein of unknown function (DUF3106)